ncbi:MAG: amidoligase family protein [Actinomycetota bacterium]
MREPSEFTVQRALARVGYEVELLAPPGESRASLAERLARLLGGRHERIFHHDTELTRVKGRPVFHHLSLGHDVYGADGDVRCRLVDDITIIADLDDRAEPTGGLYRVMSDERRIMNLVERIANPEADAASVLEPLAALYGTEVEPGKAGLTQLRDQYGASVAVVAQQGGERERVCEVIFPPLTGEAGPQLAAVLEPARDAGFRVPAEAAVHVHLDAEPFRSAPALARLVRAFGSDRDAVHERLRTNPRCRRLAPLAPALVAEAAAPGFGRRPWGDVAAWLATLDLAKHADVNLRALAGHRSAADTVEIRVLPGSIDADRIRAATAEIGTMLAEAG